MWHTYAGRVAMEFKNFGGLGKDHGCEMSYFEVFLVWRKQAHMRRETLYMGVLSICSNTSSSTLELRYL